MAATKTGRDRAPNWCGKCLVETGPWQGNKIIAAMRQKKYI
jgi:hypothetical protein